MWLFGRSKGTSYKPVQRQVSITTTQEGPTDRGDRYSTLVNSPTSFPSSSAVQEEDSPSSFDQFNISSSSTVREPLDPCTWSNVTSPGFTTRIVNQANSSPLREFNNGVNNPLNRSIFSGSPNRHLKLGQLPYSSWRQKQQQSSPLQFLPSPSRRSRGRYSDNGTVFVRIAPVDPEKTLLSPIPGSPAGNLLNLNSDNFSRSPPTGGLGGIPQTVLSAKFQRLWPSAGPLDRSMRMAPSPNSPSPGILEALANRKRTRVTDVYVDKTTTPMRSSLMNTDDGPNKSSKRVKFLAEDRNNRSLSMVPLHSLQVPDDGSMTSESILEQMNQTEKRFLPDEDPPASVRMLQKKKSSGATRSALQTSPFKKKRSSYGISIVEKDHKDKNDRFCNCTECYEDAAGVASFVPHNTSGCGDRSFSQPIGLKKSVTFNLSQTEPISPSKSVASKGTETDILAREIVITKSAASSGGIIDMAMYKTDKIRRAERLRKILSLDDPDLQDTNAPEILRENAPATVVQSTLPTTTTTSTQSFSGFGTTASSSDEIDGQKKNGLLSTFSFSQGSTGISSDSSENSENKDAPKSGGFSFGLASNAPVSSTPVQVTESSLTAGSSLTSESDKSGNKFPMFSSASTDSTNTASVTATATPFSFGAPNTTLSADSKSATPNFSFGSASNNSTSLSVTRSANDSTIPVNTTFGSIINEQSKIQETHTPETTKDSMPTTGLPTIPTPTLTTNTVPFTNFGLNNSSSDAHVQTKTELPKSGFSFSQDSVVVSIASTENKDVSTPTPGGFSFGSSTASPFSSVSSTGTANSLTQNTFSTTSVNQQSGEKLTFGAAPSESTAASSTTPAGFNFGLPKEPSQTLSKDPVTTSSFTPPVVSFGSTSSNPISQSSSSTTDSHATFGATFGGPLNTEKSQPSTQPTFSFGASTTSAAPPMFSSGIGGTASTNVAAAAPASVFGVGTSTNNTSTGFGQSTPTTVPSLFASGSTGSSSEFPSSTVTVPTFIQSTSAVSSPFGSSSTPSNNTFGQQNSGPTFGQSQNNNQTTSGFSFGSNKGSAFGAVSTASPAPPTFGSQVSSQPAFGSPARNFDFQKPPQNSQAGSGGFSFATASSSSTNNNNNNNPGGLFQFGQSAPVQGQTAAPPNFSFSTPTTTTTSTNSMFSPGIGGTSSQNPTAPPSLFGMGSSTTNSGFGQSPAPNTTNPPNLFGGGNNLSGFTPSTATPSFGQNSSPSVMPFGSSASTTSSTFGQQSSVPTFGQNQNNSLNTSGFNFGSNNNTNNAPSFGSASTTISNPPAFGSSNNAISNNPAFGSNSTSANPPPPAFGSSNTNTSNPPTFGSQATNQSGFGSPGGNFNFQTPSQTPQTGGFSFAAAANANANNNNNNNTNSQGLFQFGQQAPAQSPQGGFNFTPQTNFSSAMPTPGAPQNNFNAGMPVAGGQMFSLGSTNTTPSARRRDARPRRYR